MWIIHSHSCYTLLPSWVRTSHLHCGQSEYDFYLVHTSSRLQSSTSYSIWYPVLLCSLVACYSTYYYTQIIGDARNPPTLLAAPGFTGMAVIGRSSSVKYTRICLHCEDADPYIPNGFGAQWFVNQNNFFRSVRNFVIDLRQMPASASATGLHWQVSQATSLMNIVIEMSTEAGNNHQGIYFWGTYTWMKHA